MRAGSSRIWFSTSTNHPVQTSTNRQADYQTQSVNKTKGLQADKRLDKIQRALSSDKTNNPLVCLPTTAAEHSTRPTKQSLLVDGYTQLVTDRVADGWSCHLVTVMFSQIFGPRAVVIDRMKDEVLRVYSILLTRVYRKPRTALTDQLPVLIGALDLPVYKRDRSMGPWVTRNNGLHVHVLVLLPPTSRMTETLEDHFRNNSDLYAGPKTRVKRVHVKPVTHNHGRMVDYVLKTVLNGRLSLDDAMIVLPRARSELETAGFEPVRPVERL